MSFIKKIHHVAYRCKDAKKTVEWYEKYLEMNFILAIAEDQVPWTQHLALEVDSVDTLLTVKAKLEADGISVVGPTDHTIFKSIYFFDPSGHRLELAANTGTPKMAKMLDEVKWEMLNEWAVTKRAPSQARWMHDGSFAG